ncbi:hypothetical protein J7J18_04460 [bacterium]|nr:hypothetical protein [bacterium]
MSWKIFFCVWLISMMSAIHTGHGDIFFYSTGQMLYLLIMTFIIEKVWNKIKHRVKNAFKKFLEEWYGWE